MILPLIILYVVTLVYLAITERFRNFASLIGLQGWLLFAVALVRLHAINPAELAFICLETLLFKGILIVMRRRIFSHMVGFLVIENGVFLFSTAIGVEMPLLINFAILLDILISVLMLGIFFTKIDGKLHADDADSLTNVKD